MTYDAAREILRAAGVRPHPSTVRVLRCLTDRGPKTTAEIVAYYGVDYRSTIGMLHRLERAGLVTSYPEDLDVRTRFNAMKPRLVWEVRRS